MGYQIPILRINFSDLSAQEIVLSLNRHFSQITNPKHDISVQYAQTKLVKKNSSYFCICRIKKFDNFVDKE